MRSSSFALISATLMIDPIAGFISAMQHSTEFAAYRYVMCLGLHLPSLVPCKLTNEPSLS